MNFSKPALDPEPPPVVASESPLPLVEKKPRGRPSFLIVVAPVLVVTVTFLFWYSTWFGRPLSDSEMFESLTDTSMPHRTQHALAQVAEEIARGNPAAHRWYPNVLRLGTSKEAQFRLMAAWVMGQDPKSQDFHGALRELLRDSEPMVRANAALALVRFGDASGESQLRLLLQPSTVVAPQSGRVTFRLKPGEAVATGGAIARIKPSSGPSAGLSAKNSNVSAVDVLAPSAGKIERELVQDGAEVAAGAGIAVVSPGEQQVWESLRALYLVGRPEDLPDVGRYASGVTGVPERVRQQAALTAEAIRRRALL